ncbi:hypothetical protein ACJZ2D_009914 [Fusarium nematophilum]
MGLRPRQPFDFLAPSARESRCTEEKKVFWYQATTVADKTSLCLTSRPPISRSFTLLSGISQHLGKIAFGWPEQPASKISTNAGSRHTFFEPPSAIRALPGRVEARGATPKRAKGQAKAEV